jgi:hypothetical protein
MRTNSRTDSPPGRREPSRPGRPACSEGSDEDACRSRIRFGPWPCRHSPRVPGAASFPADVLAAAETAAKRALTEHVDRSDRPFVTLDPASSTDLDQAFTIERSGGDLILHYAIADVAWFVEDGDEVDAEAWRRGTTLICPTARPGSTRPR